MFAKPEPPESFLLPTLLLNKLGSFLVATRPTVLTWLAFAGYSRR